MFSSHFPITQPVVALMGPTAIGKTDLSIKLAKEFNLEIVSVDSMQVYRQMDIGTAKITADEMQGVKHYLIDIVDPDAHFDAVMFEKLALKAIHTIHQRGKGALLTGGTGLYLKALVEGLSQELPTFPEIREKIHEELREKGANALHEELSAIDCSSAKRIHINDTHRLIRGLEIFRGTGKTWSAHLADHQQRKKDSPRFATLLTLGLTCERSLLYKRIELRTEVMLDQGFEEEVGRLLRQGYNQDCKSMRSIGYSHMYKYLNDHYGFSRMKELLTRDTRRYAKRQYTWFSRIDDLTWVERTDRDKVFSLVSNFIQSSD